jgi:tetratricopeptide (TPR) repeat protein
MYLQQQEFQKALKEYTEALQLAHHTEGANYIRLGIGICHMRLGDLSLARLAFERVITLDESSAEGFAGLAAVELLAPEGTVERYVALLTEAHRLDPQSSPVNTALAQLALARGDLLGAESFAQVSVRYHSAEHMLSESIPKDAALTCFFTCAHSRILQCV